MCLVRIIINKVKIFTWPTDAWSKIVNNLEFSPSYYSFVNYICSVVFCCYTISMSHSNDFQGQNLRIRWVLKMLTIFGYVKVKQLNYLSKKVLSHFFLYTSYILYHKIQTSMINWCITANKNIPKLFFTKNVRQQEGS